MKPLVVLTLMVVLPLAASAQTQHLKFSQDGEFASVSGSPDPLSSFTVQVSRTASTSSGSSATLSYQAFSSSPDFTSITSTQIVGAIPASSFTGQNTQNLVLDFDTGQLDPSTSSSLTCMIDLTTFTVTCGPGPVGQIQLAFRENGVQRTRVLALEQVSTNGPFTTRVHQRSDNSSANVEGTIFGVPVSSTTATVGINHSSSIEVITSQ